MMLGNNIRIARKRMGLTQEELAMQIGVTAQAVSRWESEAGLPDTSLIVPLVQALQISTDTLFGMDQMKQEDAMYMEIKREYEKIESDEKTPADAAKKECEYIAGRLEVNPSDFVLATCMVERVANLSRYVDEKGSFKGQEFIWDKYRKKAIQCAAQVIRFCQKTEWVERAHYAVAWVYIHDRDYVSAKDHVRALPSVKSNRMQESIMAQIADFEGGVDEMKKVVCENLQNFVRAINKENLYAMESLAWEVSADEAVAYGRWSTDIMDVFSRKKELLPYCRGFFRDIYMYMIHADLREENYERAALHWNELKEGMQKHYGYYQMVLGNEGEEVKFPKRQLGNMRAYTKEYMEEKKQEILQRLTNWEGEEKIKKFRQYLD
jgi:transcriptional regulator with XRE-family HTH domain